MNWREAADLLVRDRGFRDELSRDILAPGHAGVFWECAPFVDGYSDFEYVVIPSAAVASLRLDPGAFAEHRGAGLVGVFSNLGGDARLVAPTAGYAHLVAFLREGTSAEVHALWIAVGREVRARFGRKTWLSTSGLGVSWLHVRLDSRPKYITHMPYRLA